VAASRKGLVVDGWNEWDGGWTMSLEWGMFLFLFSCFSLSLNLSTSPSLSSLSLFITLITILLFSLVVIVTSRHISRTHTHTHTHTHLLHGKEALAWRGAEEGNTHRFQGRREERLDDASQMVASLDDTDAMQIIDLDSILLLLLLFIMRI